jgi:hypothetical protein
MTLTMEAVVVIAAVAMFGVSILAMLDLTGQPEQSDGHPYMRHPFAATLSGLTARRDPRRRARRWPKRAAREGGKPAGMLVCMVIGHQVSWGPCPRCDRRAP